MNYEEIKNQEQYWDSVSESKNFTIPFYIESFSKHVTPDMKILDVGCGYGRTLNELYSINYTNTVGIDFSGPMIKRGLRQYPFLDLRKTSGASLPFDNNSFNAVLLIAVLTCIVKTQEQLYILSEIARVLQQGGILYMSDFLINQDQRNIDRYKRFQEKYGEYGIFELPEGAALRHHSREHIASLTKNFEALCFKEETFTTMNGNGSMGFYYMGKKQ